MTTRIPQPKDIDQGITLARENAFTKGIDRGELIDRINTVTDERTRPQKKNEEPLSRTP